MKRCSKGKSCGSSCIQKSRKCSAILPGRPSKELFKVEDLFVSMVQEKKQPSEGGAGGWSSFLKQFEKPADEDSKTLASTGTVKAREDSEDYDEEFEKSLKVFQKFGGSFDWKSSYGSGSKNLGEGSYGFVVSSKPPPDAVVKRGEVTIREIKILEKLSGKGVAPDLIAAELGKKVADELPDLYEGRVAMNRVRGSVSSDFSRYDETVSGIKVGDSYWALRKRLHSQGVAHNDSHPENVIVGADGKSKFVDFGLSQDNFKAAFSEAIGVFGGDRKFLPRGSVTSKRIGEGSGDWQGARFSQFTDGSLRSGSKFPPGSNLERMSTNRLKVFSEMRKMGLSNDEIADIVVTGIRQKDSIFEKGSWGKLTMNDAKRLIEVLYDGID